METSNNILEPIFLINTTMEKEDYKSFLYMTTFFKRKFTIEILAIFALVGSFIITLSYESFSLFRLLFWEVLLFALIIAILFIKIEVRYKQRVSTDCTGAFGSLSTLMFYEDKVVIENSALKSFGEIQYDNFFQLIECGNFFIFYLNANQGSLLRKKDIKELESFKSFILGKFHNKYRSI